MVKISSNGQWMLAKSEEGIQPSSLHKLVGQTHTVEVHPHVDKHTVLGKHPEDNYNKVQLARLHKNLKRIRELLKKV